MSTAADPQLALDFSSAAAAKAPRVTSDDLARLLALLSGRGWLRAAQIHALDPSLDDRRLRAIAEASDGAIVSYPGSPGFRVFDDASEAEISHAIEALRSQGKRMIARSLALERRHHRRQLVDRPQPPL
ncbi:MAG: hypothetical protein JO295_03685 [Verrucomicrobia bacterium]|nr:hypothetical protein [Verrucomicrobiota bacterium]